MIRKHFLLAALAISAGIAQSQMAPANQGMVQGGQQPPAPNIYFMSSFYGPGYYVVPSGGLLPPAGTAGISMANLAGISASTPIETGVQSTLGARPVPWPYYGYGYGSPYYGAYGAAAAPLCATEGRLINDMGPSYFAGPTAPSGPSMSLAELAAKNKTSPSRSVRTYTNADGERLTNKITIRGTTIKETPAPAPPPGTPVTPPPPK